MKFARFKYGRREGYGVVENNSVRRIKGNIFSRYALDSEVYSLDDIKLLPPCKPNKVLAVGLNYMSHLGERPGLEYPGIFLKLPSCIIGHEEPIVLPKDAGRVDHEGELVVVIGKKGRNIPQDRALDYIMGYTCGNDVSAREWQQNDLQWWRAKASDTFGPMGPFIATDLDPRKLDLELRVNGEVRQKSNTSQMIFDVPFIVSFVSRAVTLEPGDVIFSGTPGTTSPIKDGDIVEVEISGVGTLRNKVVNEKNPAR